MKKKTEKQSTQDTSIMSPGEKFWKEFEEMPYTEPTEEEKTKYTVRSWKKPLKETKTSSDKEKSNQNKKSTEN